MLFFLVSAQGTEVVKKHSREKKKNNQKNMKNILKKTQTTRIKNEERKRPPVLG